ncbi:uncharacterized protein LTHEOB_6445 [Lasiodiplodia theobromae]|uniref:uncharacterized protein n=1 Tax=Lasiodiplodia theobromae TaxID=45133 RepID=UPI0015C38925|nr:uncharacterized protein LTHEOB_6445 [Lasiodiplodia theobromae]KAF4544327.1 hypothetical protein LTHEOB_6445 [Lasiodiplodia theobromae]
MDISSNRDRSASPRRDDDDASNHASSSSSSRRQLRDMTPLSSGRPSNRPITEQDLQGFVHDPKVEAGQYYEGALVSRRSQMREACEKAKAAICAALEKNRDDAAATHASKHYPFWSTPSVVGNAASVPFAPAKPPAISTAKVIQSANFVQKTKPLREINAACRKVHEAKKAADSKKARDMYLLRSTSPIPQFAADYPPDVFIRWAGGREEFKRRARLIEGDLRARGLLEERRRGE